MEIKTLGMTISSLRKEKNMTQLELSKMMNVTDKAVSKWERDIACPDINFLPKLAQCLGVSVDDLMLYKTDKKEQPEWKGIIQTVLRTIPLAMGVAVIVLTILDAIELYDAITLLAIGVASAGIVILEDIKN